MAVRIGGQRRPRPRRAAGDFAGHDAQGNGRGPGPGRPGRDRHATTCSPIPPTPPLPSGRPRTISRSGRRRPPRAVTPANTPTCMSRAQQGPVLVWHGCPPPDVRGQDSKARLRRAPSATTGRRPSGSRNRADFANADALRYAAGLERATETSADAYRGGPAVVEESRRTGVPDQYAGCYDPTGSSSRGRRPSASGPDDGTWDDARFRSTAAGLYASPASGPGVVLPGGPYKLMRRTRYRRRPGPGMADDLEDDVRKAGRGWRRLDRGCTSFTSTWPRLTDLDPARRPLARYESVLRFQPLVADARETRGRLDPTSAGWKSSPGPPSYRLVRDAKGSSTRRGRTLHAVPERSRPRPQPAPGRGSPVRVPSDGFLYARDTDDARSRTDPGRRRRRLAVVRLDGGSRRRPSGCTACGSRRARLAIHQQIGGNSALRPESVVAADRAGASSPEPIEDEEPIPDAWIPR